MLIERIATLDDVLETHAGVLAHDFIAYRNHAYRVLNFCAALKGGTDESITRVSFGLPRAQMRGIFARWPNAGFHKRLAQLTWQRLRNHPLSPVPVLRW